jgi:hypothetical protein
MGNHTTTPIKVSTQNGAIKYPLLTPQENVAPVSVGPIARPMAPTDVAIPLIVPSAFKELAELVSKIVAHGKAKVVQKLFANQTAKKVHWRKVWLWTRVVNGVTK